jgi:hypothetical protein
MSVIEQPMVQEAELCRCKVEQYDRRLCELDPGSLIDTSVCSTAHPAARIEKTRAT